MQSRLSAKACCTVAAPLPPHPKEAAPDDPARDEHAIDTCHAWGPAGPAGDASVRKGLPYDPRLPRHDRGVALAVLANTGPGGLDASPRGDPTGALCLLGR